MSAESGRPIRILIVDDSAVMRTLLRAVVMTDARLEVVGTAIHGEAGLRAMESLKPDLVLLDVEMPQMDGLATLRAMRSRGLHLPVIMCSTLTQRGAQVTIEALATGAADYVAKPSGQQSREAAMDALAHDLVPKILALTTRQTSGSAATPRAAAQPAARDARGPSGAVHTPTWMGVPPSLEPAPSALPSRLPDWRVPDSRVPGQRVQDPRVVVIGVSTGGPAALETLLPALSADFPLPVLLVQHMPEMFTKLLAERLDGRCALHVCEAEEGMAVERGHVYVAKGNWHLEVRGDGLRGRAALRLTQAAQENHCRPAADVLFRTAVESYGGAVLGVVLTGMGADGLEGCRLICARGGAVIAQDQATSAVWGMPGAVAQAGLAQKILPLSAIAGEITQRTYRHADETGRSEAAYSQKRVG